MQVVSSHKLLDEKTEQRMTVKHFNGFLLTLAGLISEVKQAEQRGTSWLVERTRTGALGTTHGEGGVGEEGKTRECYHQQFQSGCKEL